MNIEEMQSTLNHHGFPCGDADGIVGPQTAGAVRAFQQAWSGGLWLVIDGIPGPKTRAALETLPNLSAHFTVGELRSKGNGKCYVRRELLRALEELRSRLGVPIPVISAYRDPAHNTAVGGARGSMHLYGLGADIAGVAPWQKVAGFRLFSGIGDRRGLVSHVDLRHLAGAGNLTPAATPAAPARWSYSD